MAYLKCQCGCKEAVHVSFWQDHNVDGRCPKCGYDISVHGRHDLINCARDTGVTVDATNELVQLLRGIVDHSVALNKDTDWCHVKRPLIEEARRLLTEVDMLQSIHGRASSPHSAHAGPEVVVYMEDDPRPMWQIRGFRSQEDYVAYQIDRTDNPRNVLYLEFLETAHRNSGQYITVENKELLG